jgi:TctA family transporter
VISSETANNAATGAAMIPLLALGLPGGALTAMMVGVFQMHDMEPGPLVFINSADLVWVVFAACLSSSSAFSKPRPSSTCCVFRFSSWRR